MKKKLRYLLYALLFFLPAQLLAQANHVVISQVYGAGGNSGAVYQNDFVELYNPTNADVSLNSWSLQYQSSAGVAAYSGLMPFPSTAIIKSHGYFLVQLAGSTANGIALPAADYIPLATNTTASFNMSGTSGKVALCNSTTNLVGTPASTATTPPTLLVTSSIVDFVSFGLTNYNSGFVLVNPAVPATASTTPSAPTLTTTGIDVKLSNASSTAATMSLSGYDATAGNGYETGVNSTEFVLVPAITGIAPRNSSFVTLLVATSPVTTPQSLAFGNTTIVGSSSTQTFTVAGANLTSGASVSVTGPFTISTDGGNTYSTSGTVTAAQLATTSSTTVASSVIVKLPPLMALMQPVP